MCWRKRNAWKIGIAITGILLLLLIMEWISVSVVGADAGALGQTQLGMVTVQATPTEDATVTALNKEQLTQQVAGQQHTWDNWLWSNAATFVSSFLSTLVVVVGALVGFWQWRVGRKDTQRKESDDQKAAQAKELEDRQAERERRDEEQQRWLKNQEAERERRADERFQAAVVGLGSKEEGARVGAAILLRTFLRPGYEQFYTQTFDLAVANLRQPQSKNPNQALIEALIVVFKEAFPLARAQKGMPQSLNAGGIQLNYAHLVQADLKQSWLPGASLRNANLLGAELTVANLSGADLSGAALAGAELTRAVLYSANLSGAELKGAHLMQAFLSGANLSRADLTRADLNGAMLDKTNLEDALSLQDTDLRQVYGLTKEQLAACKAKGATIDEDLTTNSPSFAIALPSPSQSNDIQALSTPSDADASSATSSTNS